MPCGLRLKGQVNLGRCRLAQPSVNRESRWKLAGERDTLPRKVGKAMQNVANRRWLLKSYPEGMPSLENWTMDVQSVPDPGPGQFLSKPNGSPSTPICAAGSSPGTNYTKEVGLGDVMQGGGVGEVVASNHPAWKIGDLAESMSFGWQEWSLLTPDVFGPAGVNKVDPKLAPIENSLSWLRFLSKPNGSPSTPICAAG